MPPCRSARVTTPVGSEIQPRICGSGGPRRILCERSSRTTSDEPPPMSNSTAPSACGSISGVQPVAARQASVSRSMTSSTRPSSSATRARKFGAVLGRAAGFGGDQPRARDAAVLHLGAADGERADGAVHRRRAQAAGQRHAFAQADDAREGVDDAEAVAGRARDEQAAIIGAEIERGIGRPAPIAGRSGLGPFRRPPTPSGVRKRRPIESGVEAWKLSGLAAHRFLNLPAAPSTAGLRGRGIVP